MEQKNKKILIWANYAIKDYNLNKLVGYTEWIFFEDMEKRIKNG